MPLSSANPSASRPRNRTFIDLSGRRVNLLVVLEPITNQRGRMDPNPRWLCECACGRRVAKFGAALRAGRPFSCGCRRRFERRPHPSEHETWRQIVRSGRCCARWARSFEAFFADMGPRPPGHRFFRRDPRLAYSPANCEWAERSSAGRRVMLTHRGETLSMSDWARRFGVSRQAVWDKLRRSGRFAEMAERYTRPRQERAAR